MEECKVLYQIKSLEKVILRNLFNCDNIEKNIKKFKITPTQMQIIEYIIKNNQKDIYQKDLEDVLLLRRATVSGVLKTMEKNNLIERVIDMKDSRVKKVVLKNSTKELFLKKIQEVETLEKIAIKDISKDDLDNFIKVIKKIKENIETSN